MQAIFTTFASLDKSSTLLIYISITMLPTMKTTIFLLLLPFIHAAPTPPQLPFPPSPDLTQGIVSTNISELAGGPLPNTTTSQQSVQYSPAGITALQLLATLENIETFFYADAIQNLTHGDWTTGDLVLNDTIETITKIAAQEAIHVAIVGAVLRLNSAAVVPACEYIFPSTDFPSFLAVANLLTSTNFGSVIGVQEQLSGSDLSLAASTTSILGVEARHDAFLRILHGDIPNPSPFETGIPMAWAYNIGLQLTVPGSCAVEVALPTYPALYLEHRTTPWTSFAADEYPETMVFEWDVNQAWVAREEGKQLYAAWVNLFNQPLYTEVKLLEQGRGEVVVPKNMKAVAFVALTTSRPSTFTDLQDATLVGPLAVAMS